MPTPVNWTLCPHRLPYLGSALSHLSRSTLPPGAGGVGRGTSGPSCQDRPPLNNGAPELPHGLLQPPSEQNFLAPLLE